MMDRVRSSRSTSGGVEDARRGVARRLQPTLGTGSDVRVRDLDPISVYPIYVVRRRWRQVKEMIRKVINLKEGSKLTCGARARSVVAREVVGRGSDVGRRVSRRRSAE